jgi:hypothetical protein
VGEKLVLQKLVLQELLEELKEEPDLVEFSRRGATTLVPLYTRTERLLFH